MTKQTNPIDPQSAFCEACLKVVPRSEALTTETKDYIVYFCGEDCRKKWLAERSLETAPRGIQEGQGQSRSRDDRLKQAIKQHPLRDEPRADSVEPDEIPPP